MPETGSTRELGPVPDGPVLVIGSTGFVGRAATESLRELGRKVVGASTTGHDSDLACDIRIPESVDRVLVAVRPAAVILAAGIASVTESWEDPAGAFTANTAGAFNLLDGTRRLAPSSQIVIASSAGVYGAPGPSGSSPFREDSPVRPASPYAASKAAAEVLCHQFTRQAGLTVTICRMFNQVGPGQGAAQAPAEFSREIALAEKRGDAGLRLTVGDPRTARDFTDVRDTGRALAGLIEARAPGVFNLCSGNPASLAEIAGILSERTRIDVELGTDPARSRKADILSVHGSSSKVREAIGWRPEIPLERSLADLLDDWRNRV
ncbi:MAG TPA: GDP-mannose 4,6-dehydratase [Solirubrobacterales bacterium]|nr:GDP-mannose 4,6-dehydratase [Solirubrobacterales bacterium]